MMNPIATTAVGCNDDIRPRGEGTTEDTEKHEGEMGGGQTGIKVGKKSNPSILTRLSEISPRLFPFVSSVLFVVPSSFVALRRRTS